MAEEVGEGIENALNLVVLTTERSGNMKKELKQTIYETVSTLGNELADRLAKDAASNQDIPGAFDRIPKTTLYSELEEETTLKWQEEWERCNKAAVTKQFFPNVRDRIHRRITINPNFTALVTCRGETKSYLYRSKITDNATCPCNMDDQTLDHILNNCTRHKKTKTLN